ncbi:MAG: HAD-IIIC family phosphatase [Ignavibacteria bacterium]
MNTDKKDFYELKKNLTTDRTHLTKVKVALLGDSVTQFLAQAIVSYAIEYNFNFDLFEAEYAQIEKQIFDLKSKLYLHSPEFVILYNSSRSLLKRFYSISPQHRENFAVDTARKLESILDTLNQNLTANVIVFNFIEEDDMVFGNYGNKVRSSFIYQIRELNIKLMELSQRYNNVLICDLNRITAEIGRVNSVEPKLYITSDMHLNLDILPEVAKNVCDIIAAAKGNVKKCVIVDLDNTLWGGIVGDDGVENLQIGQLGVGKAYTEFQQWLLELKKRGIILAVCSKNTEDIAREPFLSHPDMILKLEDFAVFIANWENKVDNIITIQRILNIGFDSIVFIDDNPFERNMVRQAIPGIIVPEMPQDPSEYLPYLKSLNLFETTVYTKEDNIRTLQYQQEAKRTLVQKMYSTEDEYLESLHMLAKVETFNDFNIPRVAQLTQRSNQFNLRTIRYNAEEIKKMSESESFLTFAFSLRDDYGDYGLTGIVILNKQKSSVYFIDTFIMSCRVLNRTFEEFILNHIVNVAKNKGAREIIGEYLPTRKNSIVKDFYKNLGFLQKDNLWVLEVENYHKKKTFIKYEND